MLLHRLVVVLVAWRDHGISLRHLIFGIRDALVLLQLGVVDNVKRDIDSAVLEGTTAVARPRLVDGDGLPVRDDGPNDVHDRLVIDVGREDQRRRHDRPRRIVRAHLFPAEARVVLVVLGSLLWQPFPVIDAHLEHVRVGPAAGVREVVRRVVVGSLQVAHDRCVTRAQVVRGAVHVPRAPGRVGLERLLIPPVAVLDHNGIAAALRRRRLDELVVQRHVEL
mmetsp:Transcript_3743/g.9424  ORF Transcript_3743/g.9424 Transcript_3743/m.9424 type:complete len:222 (+) Transcript_3743:386-1051(+)